MCASGPLPGNIIGLGSINDGTTDECRFYGYYMPANLTGTPAAVVLASGSGLVNDEVSNILNQSHWNLTADKNRIVVVVLARPKVPTPQRQVWYHQGTDVPAPTSATAPHSDEPYLAAVLADAVPRLNLDKDRLFFTGGSSGAAYTYDVACDPINGPKFRGYAAVSASSQTEKDVDGGMLLGSERCANTGRRFFFSLVMGTNDSTQYNGTCAPTDHCIASYSESARAWASFMGCSALPTPTNFGTPIAANVYRDFPGCAFGSGGTNAVRAVFVTNGGHVWDGLDDLYNGATDTNGYSTADDNWAFFSTRKWME